jgi:two-component system LytT family sensor kinase
MHAPVLVNTLGHCAGVIVFGILLYFLVIDWRRDPQKRSSLPCVAACLALLWNVGSLIGLATTAGEAAGDAIVAVSFSVLSLLPAVLMHVSLGSRRSPLLVGGYVVSSLAVLLHVADLITDAPRFHYAAILLVTFGFGILAAIALGYELAGREKHGSGKRLAGAIVLLLFAVSFVHFRADHNTGGWSGEAALHHAAIPLALFVLLQDYRFLLLDAFVRFLTNAVLAALTVWAGLNMHNWFNLLPRTTQQPVYLGLGFVGACLLVGLFAFLRGWMQRVLTRVVFLRAGSEKSLARLREIPPSDPEFLKRATEILGETFSTNRTEIMSASALAITGLRHAAPVLDRVKYGCPAWVQVVAPVRFSRGDDHFFCLGARSGGRRYLSEDMELLDRMTGMISEQIERIRNSEMEALVTHAELRALQAQINPHFFFNALNTLYGAIPRESETARRLVLNLADLFRVSFASERSSIRIEEELKLVRAYLEIEQLRLGSKLRTEIEVDQTALQTEVPVLSIQPLVENAVKHGVAATGTGGFVRLRIRRFGGTVSVEVSNSGTFRPNPEEAPLHPNQRYPIQGTGVGLANVRRRLSLCFGERGELTIVSADETTIVSFSVPLTADMAGRNGISPVRQQHIVRE